jgi:CCR4-NOT transcriptional regulation complex NOT5 subunit
LLKGGIGAPSSPTNKSVTLTNQRVKNNQRERNKSKERVYKVKETSAKTTIAPTIDTPSFAQISTLTDNFAEDMTGA